MPPTRRRLGAANAVDGALGRRRVGGIDDCRYLDYDAHPGAQGADGAGGGGRARTVAHGESSYRRALIGPAYGETLVPREAGFFSGHDEFRPPTISADRRPPALLAPQPSP